MSQSRQNPQPETPEYGDGAFETLVGDSTKSRTLRYLIEHDDRHKQQEIAQEIGRTQPIVSRALSDFEDLGLVDRSRNGVRLEWADTVHHLSTFVDWINRQQHYESNTEVE